MNLNYIVESKIREIRYYVSLEVNTKVDLYTMNMNRSPAILWKLGEDAYKTVFLYFLYNGFKSAF